MTVQTRKFSEFIAGTLGNTDKYVGLSGGANAIFDATVDWTTLGRPVSPANGQLGFNTDLNYYEYWSSSSASWVPISAGGSVLAVLASHAPGEGASLIGLEGVGTVQDLAEAKYILQMPSSAAPNGQALSDLSTGILKSTTGSGLVSISVPLTSIDGLVTAANKMLYTTASNVYATTDLTAYARTLLDDANAATAAVTLQVLPLLGGTMLGQLNMGGFKITNGVSPTVASDYATKGYVDSGAFLPLVGGTMSGQIDMGNQKIINLGDPTNPQDAVTQFYLAAQLNNYLAKSGGTMTGTINMNSHYITGVLDPVNSQDAATKAYVDLVATGLNVQGACYAATTADLAGYTYANGAAGIGATLTAGGVGVFTTDGTSPPVNSRILVKDQTDTYKNGIYDLTVTNAGLAAVLTRATDYDQPAEINPGDLVVVNNGTLYGTSSWLQTATVTTVGTDPILFSQFTANPASYLLKASNLSDVSSTTAAFDNISPLTTKGDLIGYDTGNTRLAVGATDGMILQVFAADPTGLAWSTATYPVTTTANELLYSSATNVISGLATANGGVLVTNNLGVPSMLANPGAANRVLLSGNSAISAWSTASYPDTTTINRILYSSANDVVGQIATANSATLYTNSTGVPAFTGSMTDGQILIGSTGASPTVATLTAGSGVTITNSAGGIEIEVTGVGNGGWQRTFSLMGG